MKLVAVTIFLVSVARCVAQDVAFELKLFHTNYDLAPLENPKSKGTLAFHLFVRPALSDAEYALAGSMTVTERDVVGSLSMFRPAAIDPKSQMFQLSRSQVLEVFSWFADAEFLNPEIQETIPATVLDGVALVIEGYVDGRYFRLHRNAGDSLKTQDFYKRVEAFRIWKTEANQ